MPTYILQVVVTTEEDYTKKRVREAVSATLGCKLTGKNRIRAFHSYEDETPIFIDRIFVRRDLDKQ